MSKQAIETKKTRENKAQVLFKRKIVFGIKAAVFFHSLHKYNNAPSMKAVDINKCKIQKTGFVLFCFYCDTMRDSCKNTIV